MTKLAKTGSMARLSMDTVESDRVEMLPGAPPPGRFDLPDSFPWYRLRSRADVTAVSMVWRSAAESIPIDTHNGFTGGLFRLSSTSATSC
jgi:hypothetical protein